MLQEYSNAISVLKDSIWRELSKTTISQALSYYLTTLSSHTMRSYRSAFESIFLVFDQKNLLDKNCTLQTLAVSNLENLLDYIHREIKGKESTKKCRCAAFVSFTKYLDRSTSGMIRAVKPVKGVHFRIVRNKSNTEAICHDEWVRFIYALKKHSLRDYLIAKAMFQGAKRISEVLNATIDQIDWENGRITYKQSKSAVVNQNTVISYSMDFMQELKTYLLNRKEGFIFQTKSGKKVTQPHIYRNFSIASMKAGLKKRVHPHMLRTSAVTLLMKMGYHSDDIMKVSGHSTPRAVLYYDKSCEEDNLTNNVKLC